MVPTTMVITSWMRAADFAKLVKVTGRSGDWITARCPAHEDRRASFSFRDGDHAVMVKCHVGCSRAQILAALNLTPNDLRFETPDNGGPPPRREIVATYDYRDERGTLLYQVVRFKPKDFRMRRPDGHGGWDWSMTGIRKIMYRLDELAESVRAHQSEGERRTPTGS
jgi:putative DNA primase/helicase